VAVETVEQEISGVHLRDSDGIRHGPYDLLVIADGTRSRLRDQLGITSFFKQYEYGALFALLPDEEHVFGRTLHQVHAGPGTHTTLGFLHTGLPWQGGIDTAGDGRADTAAESVATLYYNLRADEHAEWQRGGLERFKERCAELMPHAAEVLHAGLHSQEQITFARFSDGGMWRYNRGRCVVRFSFLRHSITHFVRVV
jgi:2-polyprenyl-6-methoxyphenol hydroxylase-like FAD-dependent oxidoreductase